MLSWVDKVTVTFPKSSLGSLENEKYANSVQIVCDWIEAQVLFSIDNEVFLSDIVDLLLKEEVVTDQDDCWAIVYDAYQILMGKHSVFTPDSMFEFTDDVITLKRCSSIGLKFCSMLSILGYYRSFENITDVHYENQGDLFELFCCEAVNVLFPKWKTVNCGTSPRNHQAFDRLVSKLSSDIGETKKDYSHCVPDLTNDLGLDMYCYYPFKDNHSSYPIYLFQCASGKNWVKKVHEPELSLWKACIEFSIEPQKAFAMPFALHKKKFNQYTRMVQGVLFDRYRLLSMGMLEEDWMSEELCREIRDWLDIRLKFLPKLDE